jgi:hypothetical protein
MKRLVVFVIAATLILVPMAYAGNGTNLNQSAPDSGKYGPAPNSGDGIPDGSGFDGPNGPNADSQKDPKGPAPNSGDGIPDGSGFDELFDMPFDGFVL